MSRVKRGTVTKKRHKRRVDADGSRLSRRAAEATAELELEARREILTAAARRHKVGEARRLARFLPPVRLEDLEMEPEDLDRALHVDVCMHAARLRHALGAAADVEVPHLRRADARAVAVGDEPASERWSHANIEAVKD